MTDQYSGITMGHYRCWRLLYLLLMIVAATGPLLAEELTPTNPTTVDPNGIKGKLFLCGGGELPEELMKLFMQHAGGEKSRIIVVPTAQTEVNQAEITALKETWRKRGAESVGVLHTRDRKTADSDEFNKPLATATGVWFLGGSQSRIAEAYLGTAVERGIAGVLQRGGIVGGSSAGAAVMSRVMIARGNPHAELETGFDLLPGTIIDQHFLARHRKPRLMGALKKHPGLVGVGIDERTALLVYGRSMQVLGESAVTVLLGASATRPVREMTVKAQGRLDLTALRRAAIARTQPDFPQKETRVPHVDKGSLVIVGGGGMPTAVTERFIELAGGPDALIVVLPTAVPAEIARRTGVPRFFTNAGAKNVKVLPARTPQELAAPEFVNSLEKAGGVWFGGGRQWRFVDAYEGTPAVSLFRKVLERGGVIGGSSAGASIQAEYLVRGHPLGNRVMMAEGYERGFGFLPGVAIDQHFSQRERFADMTSVMKTFPQLLGIGIDEATAMVVKGHIAEIIGRNRVHFYDYSQGKPADGSRDYVSVDAERRYDLKARRVLPTTK